MSRKIILLSDGTGNSAAKVWRTNVWRLFESLDLSGSDQVALYDDGVGTSSFKLFAMLGGTFGFGLKRNVLDLYKFACRNYRDPRDEIFGFGFSRGAFTIRIVVGLILEQGLVKADNEQELDAKAKAAYRAFRKDNFETIWKIEKPARWLRDLGSTYKRSDNRHDVTIRFLGLWDTVAAYGMPIEEMARGISQWIWPWQFPDCNLHPDVIRACHALSIDDERTTFYPVLWDERTEPPLAPGEGGKRWLKDERVSQVWFAGAHSNVGGGYPDDSMAQIPLVWIMAEAQHCNLRFKTMADALPQTFGHSISAQDKDGRIYDPRQGFGGYYRYGPRDLAALGGELLTRNDSAPALPRIHESVLRRIENNAQGYAPKGLPARYEIVTPDCEVLAPQANGYEQPAQADARANLQNKVWNIVWLRRVVYFITVCISVWLVAFPLIDAPERHVEFENPLRWVADIVRMAGAFLPGVASPWINGYAREPGQFVIVVALLAIALKCGALLASRIDNRMARHWQGAVRGTLVDPSVPTDLLYKLRTHPIYKATHRALKRYIAPAFFALLFAYLGLTLTSHVLYNVQDVAGWVCKEDPKSGSLARLAVGETLLAGRRTTNQQIAGWPDALPVFRTSELCQSTGLLLQRGGRYLITFESVASFQDGGISASAVSSIRRTPTRGGVAPSCSRPSRCGAN